MTDPTQNAINAARRGQPAYYTSPEEMQKDIDAYFDKIEITKSTEDRQFPTITGLALALGFTSRQALINYEEKDNFFDTIKKAKLRVEQATEQRLFHPNATGTIFNLKNNFGWEDKSAVDSTLKGDKDNPIQTSLTVEIVSGNKDN